MQYDDRTLTLYQKQQVLKRFDDTCVYCFKEAACVDHIIPWSYKHDDSPDNLVASCQLCNCIASNKVFESFGAKWDYIDKRKKKWEKRKPTIWLKQNVIKLGYALRKKIENTCIIVNTEKEYEHIKHILQLEGIDVE